GDVDVAADRRLQQLSHAGRGQQRARSDRAAIAIRSPSAIASRPAHRHKEDRVTPIVYGTEFSTYVRSVRMAFEEKGAAYELHDVSVLKGEQKQAAHLARNPFGTVPAFAHDGLEVYETSPILRYIDQVFPGAALTPEDPKQRARMNQIISIVDYHGYASIIGQI